ncbi:MAG: hypothetical protein ACTS2F_05795 [Thainema sp.]
MPQEPIFNIQERHNQSVIEGQLAPNSIEIQADTDNINEQVNEELQQVAPGFELQTETLRMRTRFAIQHSAGNHHYGEGIEVNVYRPDGTLQSSEKVFVSGDRVRIDPNGQSLPQNAHVDAVYGAEDTVELRVLNLRPGKNGGQSTEHESAIYIVNDGDLAVEDGFDHDFNDGDYLLFPEGDGEAHIIKKTQEISSRISYYTEVIETTLNPFVRQEQTVDETTAVSTQQFTEVEESRDYGEIELSTTNSNTLFHAAGVRTPEDEQLIYSQYSAAAQLRLGTDGASLTGQLAPLNDNPDAAPTLLTGSVSVNPSAGNNQAGLVMSVGLTQFFNSTHQDAIDMYGNPIVNPDPDGPRLLQPTGLNHNTRIVGYVPAIPDEVVPGEQLSPINGVLELPTDKDVIIAPPNPNLVGRGDSAYADNVGGLIIEWSDGRIEFMPQWNQDGYVTNALTIEAGQAQRVIYALVPQQDGQALQLNQTYAVNLDKAAGYLIADGGFRVISAAHHPGNFVPETTKVYAVEDTLPSNNAVTNNFNGIQGSYVQTPGGDPVATVDNRNPGDADARVGTILSTPDELIPGAPGQSGYYATTVAGGLYARGSLTLGLGNQEDVITTTTSFYEAQVETLTRTITTDTFHTPVTQVDTITTETTETTFTTTQQEGIASFDVNSDGILSNLKVTLDPEQVFEEVVTDRSQEHSTEILHGTEFLYDSTIDAQSTSTVGDPVLVNRQAEASTDTYPNFSPLVGELALGYVLNFGNTPWTAAANTIRAELFARGVVLGQQSDGGDVGLRAELVVNPFGEQQRPAYGYDADGNLFPIYKTAPQLDENGDAMFTLIEDVNGNPVQVALNQFIYDENSDHIQETVGTGDPVGPGIFLRVEEVLTDDDGPLVSGGLQFTF